LWTSIISFSGSSAKGFFCPPNFLMIRSILVFVQCIQIRFTEDGLNFMSSAILMVLSPLFLARMIYRIFLSVSFTTLFLFPCPFDGYINQCFRDSTVRDPLTIVYRVGITIYYRI
jgi:hypothetical protein